MAPRKKIIGMSLIPVTVGQFNQFYLMICKNFDSKSIHLFALFCHFRLQ
jgi:hypothetical protein